MPLHSAGLRREVHPHEERRALGDVHRSISAGELRLHRGHVPADLRTPTTRPSAAHAAVADLDGGVAPRAASGQRALRRRGTIAQSNGSA